MLAKVGTFFYSSLMEMKKLKSLVMMGILVAFCIAVEPLTLVITPDLMIRWSFVFIAIAGFMFGPVSAGLAAVAVDIINFMLFPKGAFFPGYTVSALLGGLIYGIFLYRRKVRSWGFIVLAVACKTVINVGINICLNTYWTTFFSEKSWIVLLPTRIIKNIALLPVECVIIIAVLFAVDRISKRAGWYDDLPHEGKK